MKCPKCGIEMTSLKIYKIHVRECKKNIKEVEEEINIKDIFEEFEEVELTKKEICKLLDEKEIEYNYRDKKEILIHLLNEVK